MASMPCVSTLRKASDEISSTCAVRSALPWWYAVQIGSVCGAAALDQRDTVLEGVALPVVVQPAPGRDAVHIGRDRRYGQLADVIPGQHRRGVDFAIEAQPPSVHVIARRAAI